MAKGRTVLVVDDEEGTRLFVSSIMLGEGWETMEAYNGQEAVDLAETHAKELDLIILDVNMPVMNGFEAYRRIRDGYFTKDIPIIMLTGINTIQKEFQYDAKKMEEVFGQRPPEGFVDKPVDPDQLIHSVFGAILE
jgi:CheY-like chemotaxis protein